MMPLRRLVVVSLLLLVSSAVAAEQPASDESIREVLRVTEAEKLIASMLPQVEAMMGQAMQQGLSSVPMPPDERVVAGQMAEKMKVKLMAGFREEMQWSKLEPMYLRIYRKTFTQDEVDGMLAFYKTPAGRAVIKKMPAVMQETMVEMQQVMQPMMKKMQTAVQETVEEMKARYGQPKK